MSYRTYLVPVTVMMWLLVPAVRAADSKSASPADRAAELVKQLHDRSFRVRERASRALAEMGPDAVPALRAEARDPDSEVRRRCLAILPLALKRDQERRLQALLANGDIQEDAELPGWDRYRRLVGNDRTARQLYADMVRTNGDLLTAGERDPAKAANLVNSRAQILQASGTSTGSLVDLAVLAFVGSNPKSGAHGLNYWMVGHLIEERYPKLAETEARKKCVRPLLAAFVHHCIDAGQVQTGLRLAFALELKETGRLAAKYLKDKKIGEGDRAFAAYVLGRIGSKEDISTLEGLLNDHAQFASFSTGGVNGTTQVGDVALASLLRLTGQNLQTYGYPAANLDEASLRIHAAAILGFAGDAARSAAKARWRTWAAKNLPKPAAHH